ncbi:transcriptional activator Mut3p [Fusarium heterosporum]|uniref:Transcriptional activator Mut3p n=1 Tax=Fusarium heterosporum TaxID=42747 RepID=A0A8H5TJY4_FUSHE|nr:transcriptional activator Mut3p [Fusarium heterosporum]
MKKPSGLITPNSVTTASVLENLSDSQPSQSYLEGLCLLNGLSLFSEEGQRWIEGRARSRISSAVLDKLRLPYHHSPLSTPPSMRNQNALQLPFPQDVERTAKTFCSSMQFLVFPLLSIKHFIGRTLPLANSRVDSNQHGIHSARACVYGVMVISDTFGHNTGRGMPDVGNECARYAIELENSIPMILQEVTKCGLEALTMLMVYKYFIGDLQSASFLVSMATRLIFRLRAHVPPETDGLYDKNNLDHHMRDLFWICYSIDKDLPHRTGQPPSINDHHCDLTLPANYAEMQSSNILTGDGASAHNAYTVPLYPWDLRLSIIKSKIFEDLYSLSGLRQPEAEILRRIRCLDDELEIWRIALPIDHRPTLSFLEQTPVDANTNTQAIMLRLCYHHCITLIHKARCMIFGTSLIIPNMVDDGHAANLQLLVDASKSILTYLEKALPVLAHECFWIAIFYPMTAIVTIFSVALLHNKKTPILRDLERLEDFAQVIRQIPIRRLTVAEITHLDFIEELVVDMSSLIGGAADIPVNSASPIFTFTPVTLPAQDRRVDLDLKVTAPATGDNLPIILLSHGHGPSNYLSSLKGYGPLVDWWASHGFVVIQPTHLSSRQLGYQLGSESVRELFMDSRVQDMVRILDNIDTIEETVPLLKGRLDKSKIAVAGHSLGSLTASVLMGAVNTDPRDGAKQQSSDSRIKAGVVFGALGSGGESLSENGRNMLSFFDVKFDGMSTPALVIWGDEDVSPHLSSREADWHQDPYTLAPGPKSSFKLKGGKHGFGGISGWDALECQDESAERLAASQRVSWAYLRSQLYPGDDSWEKARKAIEEHSNIGSIEEKYSGSGSESGDKGDASKNDEGSGGGSNGGDGDDNETGGNSGDGDGKDDSDSGSTSGISGDGVSPSAFAGSGNMVNAAEKLQVISYLLAYAMSSRRTYETNILIEPVS